MMKVCHLTSVHSHDDVRIFVKECCTLAQAGYDVHLVAPGAPESINMSITVHGVPKDVGPRLARMTKTVRAVYRKARMIDADLYHFHDPELLLVGFLLKKLGKVVIYDAHEDVPLQVMSKPWIPRWLRKTISLVIEVIENATVRRIDAVFTATDDICKRFRRVNANAYTLNNYVLTSEYGDINDAKRKANTVCYVGVISEIRGIKEMVNAISPLNGRLKLAGNFSSDKLLHDTMALPGWCKVEYLGFVNRSTFRAIYEESTVGLEVSYPVPNYLTASSNKMFEYMSAAIPVVASNFPIWKEIIEANQCGICVDPLDDHAISLALLWIFEHPVEAKQMGLNGRKAVLEKYNWENEAKTLVNVYKKILKRHPYSNRGHNA